MLKAKPILNRILIVIVIVIVIEAVAQRCSAKKVFCKKGALRSLAKFTGKHLCQNLFFDPKA